MQIKIDIAGVFPLLAVDCQCILWESNVVAAKCSISCTKPALHKVCILFSLIKLLPPNKIKDSRHLHYVRLWFCCLFLPFWQLLIYVQRISGCRTINHGRLYSLCRGSHSVAFLWLLITIEGCNQKASLLINLLIIFWINQVVVWFIKCQIMVNNVWFQKLRWFP